MKLGFFLFLGTLLISGLIGCSKSDQERARENAAEAQRKGRAEARKLEQDAKRGAHEFNARVDSALKDHPRDAGAALNQAGQKLDTAAHVARAEGEQAAAKLSRAALIAKVKAKLASDAGLSTASSLEVDVNGDVVTLKGTLPSDDLKREALQAASQVNGVSRVIDRVSVEH